MSANLFYVFCLLFVGLVCGQQPHYPASNVYGQGSSTNLRFQPQPHPPNVRSTTGVEQYGARYPSSNVRPVSAPAAAYGVVQHQQPRAQPLPPALISTAANSPLAPLATVAAPVSSPAAPSSPYNVPPQQPPSNGQTQSSSYFYPPPVYPAQPYAQSNAVDYPGYAQTNNPTPAYQNNPYAQREPPVTHFTFKEGTPPYYCAYGLPVPEYNTPRKRCVPNWPGCGWAFTCIFDV